MKKLLLSLLLASSSIGIASARQRIIPLLSLGIKPNQAQSIAPRLRFVLDSLKQTQTDQDSLRLIFSPGRYYFDEAGCIEREVYISNHDQIGKRHIGLLLDGYKHLTLEGMGSQFIFWDRMLPLALINSQDVRVSGISIDFSEPQITQVEVVRNLGKSGIEFRPAPWVRWRINEQGLFESYGSNWKHTPQSGIVFNRYDFHTKYKVSDLAYSTKGVRSLGNNILLAPQWIDERLGAGDIIAMRSWHRPQPAVFVDASTDTQLSNITIHYADGMGLLAQNSHNISLDHFSVARKGNNDPRYFTTQADATHFSGCSGHIDVRNGLFEHMMDDAINVHGIYLKMTKRLDDYTIEAQYMHSQAWGFEWGRIGDPVQFIYSKTFDSHKGYNAIASISSIDTPSVLGAKKFRIRFKHKLAGDLTPDASIGLENMRKIPSVTFIGNTIRNNRARGALFNTSKLVRVEGNYFDHVSGAAIVASTDCNQWFESGQTQALLIRGNIFKDVLTSLYQFTEAAISLHPVIPELKKQKTPFYGNGQNGICIEDNVFMTFDTPLLYALSVKGLLWQRNLVVDSKAYPKYHWNQERYKTIGCADIKINE